MFDDCDFAVSTWQRQLEEHIVPFPGAVWAALCPASVCKRSAGKAYGPRCSRAPTASTKTHNAFELPFQNLGKHRNNARLTSSGNRNAQRQHLPKPGQTPEQRQGHTWVRSKKCWSCRHACCTHAALQTDERVTSPGKTGNVFAPTPQIKLGDTRNNATHRPPETAWTVS